VTRDTGLAPANWLSNLFSASHGFLSLTPVAYIAVLGTIAYLRRNAFCAAAALVTLTAWVAVNASAVALSSGDAAFRHGLTAALAVLAPGLAYVIDAARRRPLAAIAPLAGFALAWNYWLMVQYTVGALPKDEPVLFATMVRQQADMHTRSPYLYPFAFPASVWFALREGVPAERFDLLADEPQTSSIDLVMDRRADRFLLEGWDAPGADAGGPVHWIGQPRATVVLPLDVPGGRDVVVSVLARTRLEQPAVEADLGLEINGHEIGRFVVPAAAPSDAQITVPAADVGRILRAGYNRVTFVSYGVRRVDPADRRPPGPLASRPGNRAWPVAIYRIRLTAAP